MPTVCYRVDNKSWAAYKTDTEGNQVGDCEYGPSKHLAIVWLERRIWEDANTSKFKVGQEVKVYANETTTYYVPARFIGMNERGEGVVIFVESGLMFNKPMHLINV